MVIGPLSASRPTRIAIAVPRTRNGSMQRIVAARLEKASSTTWGSCVYRKPYLS